MATTVENTDLEEVVRAAYERRPVAPEVARRVRERAEAVKAEIRRGPVTDLAVPLIRESREA